MMAVVGVAAGTRHHRALGRARDDGDHERGAAARRAAPRPVIAQGSPAEVSRNPAVMSAYLGETVCCAFITSMPSTTARRSARHQPAGGGARDRRPCRRQRRRQEQHAAEHRRHQDPDEWRGSGLTANGSITCRPTTGCGGRWCSFPSAGGCFRS